MLSVQFRHIITHFFNAHCVAVHKPFDPICEERRHDQSHEFTMSSTSSSLANLRPREALFTGPNK